MIKRYLIFEYHYRKNFKSRLNPEVPSFKLVEEQPRTGFATYEEAEEHISKLVYSKSGDICPLTILPIYRKDFTKDP